MKSAHVVVIGGGVMGTASAYYLAREGVDVILLEKDELASGTSGANLGNMSLHNRMPGPILDLNLRSLGMYQSLSEELGYDIEYVNTRGLALMERDEQLPFINERLNRQKKAGLCVTLVDREELNRVLPHIAPDLAGAVACNQSSRVNSPRVVFGYALGARELGARILLHTEVQEIKTLNKSVSSVVTNSGEIKTKFVVVAAGAWSPQLGRTAGLSIPVTPIRGNILVTESIPSQYLQIVAEIQDVEMDQGSTLSSDQNREFNVRMVFSPTPSGNILIGRSEESAGYDNSVNYRVIRAVARRAIRFFPCLRDLHCIRTYAGLRPCTPDDFPIIDRLDSPEGIILATGHGDKGINLAPMTGKIVSELIIHGVASDSIQPFRFARFSEN
jgi:glycine/D-amino acid oxidase-like deaminating enzyme